MGDGTYLDALNGAYRTSPDYILIDAVDAAEVATAVVKGAASAFRIIGAVDADSLASVEKIFNDTIAPQEIIAEVLDLVIVAKSAQDIQVAQVRTGK